jgi:hypothetical protein
MGRLVFAHRLGALEPFGQEMDQGCIDIVDAVSQAQQFRVGHSASFCGVAQFPDQNCLSETERERQKSSAGGLLSPPNAFISLQGERRPPNPFHHTPT